MPMYSNESDRKAHLKDFKKVLERLEKEPNVNQYRLSIIKDCIQKCED